MYLVHRLCDLTLKETAARFSVGSAGVIGWPCGEVPHRLLRDTRFRERLAQVEGRISKLRKLSRRRTGLSKPGAYCARRNS